jgi:hypothetical protein
VRRPKLEVADVFHRHGADWRKANAGHVSLGQLQVMSAIEQCRSVINPGDARLRSLVSDLEKKAAHGFSLGVDLD